MIEKDKWAVAECLGLKIGLSKYTYELASDAVDLLITLGWCPPAPPTDAEIEAAAEALRERGPANTPWWDDWVWECFARAALVAARKVRDNA